jgi:hypothetical protein
MKSGWKCHQWPAFKSVCRPSIGVVVHAGVDWLLEIFYVPYSQCRNCISEKASFSGQVKSNWLAFNAMRQQNAYLPSPNTTAVHVSKKSSDILVLNTCLTKVGVTSFSFTNLILLFEVLCWFTNKAGNKNSGLILQTASLKKKSSSFYPRK